MYRYILAAVLSIAIATPALADQRRYHHDRGPYVYNHHYYQVQQYRHRNNDKWVVPLIGGVILGAVINEASKPKDPEVIVIKQKCEPVTIVVQDQWGRTIERRTEERCTTIY
jgi:hypothetical protein